MENKKPSLAIVFRGISYSNKKGISHSNKVDYTTCIESYKLNVLPSLKKVFGKIDTFLYTYYSEKMIDIINDYNPKDIALMPNSSLVAQKNANAYVGELICKSFDLAMSAGDYDYILELRFDLYFYKRLDETKLDLDKINIAWRGEVGQCDDAFVIFPKKYIPIAREYYKSGRCTHYIHKHTGYDILNFISKDVLFYDGYPFADFYIIDRFIKYRDLHKGIVVVDDTTFPYGANLY